MLKGDLVGEGVGSRNLKLFLLTRQGFLSTAIEIKWNRAVLQQVDVVKYLS